MSVKQILFNTEMVRAILDGRKSCTRRIVKPQPQGRLCYTFAGGDCSTWGYPSKTAYENWGDEYKLPENITDEALKRRWNPPYHTDDILYVRETVWQKVGHYLDIDGETKGIFYNEYKYVATDDEPKVGWNHSWIKRPSIHMPKKAARIWLKVTDVRVKRLQEMWASDVPKEGIYFNKPTTADEMLMAFAKLWNSTIKESVLDRYGWDANPWVWVIEFERCEKPESEGN